MPSQDLTSIAALIVHYQNWPDVLDTVQDTLDQGVPIDQIAVVDNGSPAHARRDALERHPELTWISDQGNVGYAAAVNLGVEFAKSVGADHFLVLTHEVRLGENCLVELLRALIRQPQMVAVGPVLHRKSDPSSCWSSGGDLNTRTGYPTARREAPTSDSIVHVDWVDGACFLNKIEAHDEVAGLFEPYFLYMEEVDYFASLRKKGYNVGVVGSARALQEPGSMSIYLATRNRLILCRRQLSPLATAYTVVETILRLIHGSLMNFGRGNDKNRERFLGLLSGLRTPITSPRVRGD